MIYSKSDVVLAKILFGGEAAALITIAQRFSGPLALVVNACSAYFYPKLCAGSEYKKYSVQYVSVVIFLSLSGAIFIYFCLPFFLEWFFSEEYQNSLGYINLYLIAAVFGNVAIVVSSHYHAHGLFNDRLYRAILSLSSFILLSIFLGLYCEVESIAISYLIVQIMSASVFNWGSKNGYAVWKKTFGGWK